MKVEWIRPSSYSLKCIWPGLSLYIISSSGIHEVRSMLHLVLSLTFVDFSSRYHQLSNMLLCYNSSKQLKCRILATYRPIAALRSDESLKEINAVLWIGFIIRMWAEVQLFFRKHWSKNLTFSLSHVEMSVQMKRCVQSEIIAWL